MLQGVSERSVALIAGHDYLQKKGCRFSAPLTLVGFTTAWSALMKCVTRVGRMYSQNLKSSCRYIRNFNSPPPLLHRVPCIVSRGALVPWHTEFRVIPVLVQRVVFPKVGLWRRRTAAEEERAQSQYRQNFLHNSPSFRGFFRLYHLNIDPDITPDFTAYPIPPSQRMSWAWCKI